MNNSNNPVTETKLCKHCHMEIPKKAKVCPYCRKKQGGFLKTLLIVIIVLFIVAGIIGGNSEEKPTASKVATSPESQTETTEEASEIFHVGDVVETKYFRIKYLSAEEYEETNEYFAPKDGYVLYRMEFEFENISNIDRSVTMADFECYADSYDMNQTYRDDTKGMSLLSPGKKAVQAVYYEVPQDASEITLEYKENALLSDRVVFSVK